MFSSTTRKSHWIVEISLDNVLTVTFPNSAVIFLRHSGKTPNEMRIRMITPGGMTEYLIPVVKVQKYSMKRKLFGTKLSLKAELKVSQKVKPKVSLK